MKSVSAIVIWCFICIGCCSSSGGVRRLTEDNEKIKKLKFLLRTDLKDEMNSQNAVESWKTKKKETDKKMILNEMERQGNAIANQIHKSRNIRQRRSMTGINITDPSWPLQWHLQPDQTPSIGVYEAWQKGYTGKGIVVGLVDEGMDTKHSDLINNYGFRLLYEELPNAKKILSNKAKRASNASLSYDFIEKTVGGSYLHYYETHGTRAAGVIAASKNDQCIIGIAYEATIVSFRTATQADGVTDAGIAKALTYNNNEIDIYNNAYGEGVGHGEGYYPATELIRSAILQGITEGRNGKGSIYVLAAGNDGDYFDDCNTVEMKNSMYTITVNSMAPDGSPATYTEECTCIMVATYGGQDYGNGTKMYLPTTNIDSTCIENYGGTAAAASVASGILALTLQANPDLTWRDVQHLLVETSTFHDVPEANFTVNGAGKNVSVSYGFGVMNAERLVETAPSWKTVPERLACTSGKLQVDKCCSRTVETSYVMEDCLIQYLEHVQVHVLCKAEWREYTEIHLVSPQGTDSRILRQRKNDLDTAEIDWTFISLHYWGENPSGNWSIRMEDFLDCDNDLNLYSWTLTVYGTITNPLEGIPSNGMQGGYCDDGMLCTDGTNCLLDFNICVDCTIPGHRVLDTFCVRDGYGFCNTSIPCKDEDARCNEDNVCVTCATGYREINEICKQDGMLGGYCDDLILCKESDVACDSETNLCMNCTNGYHIVDDFCKKDGVLRGYCDTETPCIVTETGFSCHFISNTCVNCLYYDNHRILKGFCIEDGTLGGYCGSDTTCNVTGSGCNAEIGVCVDCSMAGYRSVEGYCIKDGTVGGYCDREVVCDNETGCGFESNVCVNCSSSGYRVLPDGYCREDGMIDGYCDSETPCVTFAAACVPSYNICAICYAGNTIVDGYCIEDEAPDYVVVEAEQDSNTEAVAGFVIAGFATGVLINGVVFIIARQRALHAKSGNVS